MSYSRHKHQGSLTTAHHIMLAVWIGVVVFVAMATGFAGHAGKINTMNTPFAGIATMTFIGWWLLNLVILVANTIFCRKLTLVSAVAIIVTIKPFLVFCPLNLWNRPTITDNDTQRTFSVLSYNVAHMQDSVGMVTLGYNRTASTILSSDADVVCLMEYTQTTINPISHEMLPEQYDSLLSRYPYHETYAADIAVFSRTPITALEHPQAAEWPRSGVMGIYSVEVCGRPLTLIPVHLCSIGLSDDDKDLYRDLVDSPAEMRGKVSDMRHKLIEKLYTAFQQRYAQTTIISNYLAQTSENAIVCGDFNDVPNCYAIRTLEAAGMTDAYSQVGIGAKITFNAPLFFFRIDHVLYRGNMTPVNMQRGNLASSDHYPWLTTFVWTEEPQRGTND